jgi:hypothetical protein
MASDKTNETTADEPGVGHNKPPPEEGPSTPLPMPGWYLDDQTGAQIARDAAARQRNFIATINNSQSVGPVIPPLVQSEPSVLHAAMLKRIAALEETIANLTGEEQIDQRLLREIEEVKTTLANLKVLPPAPAAPPAEAIAAQSKLRRIGETLVALQAASELWHTYGDRLIALAKSIGDWIASLPLPPH